MSESNGATRDSPFHRLSADASKIIAKHVSLGSLARLCTLSKVLNQNLSPILYTFIDTPKRPDALLATLAGFDQARKAALGVHPAALVRGLRIVLFFDTPYGIARAEKERHEKQKDQLRKLLISALENTARVSKGNSQLEFFSLAGNVGLEDVGKVLSDQHRFSKLKKLSICPRKSSVEEQGRKCFDVSRSQRWSYRHELVNQHGQFLLIPQLTYLEYGEDISSYTPGSYCFVYHFRLLPLTLPLR